MTSVEHALTGAENLIQAIRKAGEKYSDGVIPELESLGHDQLPEDEALQAAEEIIELVSEGMSNPPTRDAKLKWDKTNNHAVTSLTLRRDELTYEATMGSFQNLETGRRDRKTASVSKRGGTEEILFEDEGVIRKVEKTHNFATAHVITDEEGKQGFISYRARSAGGLNGSNIGTSPKGRTETTKLVAEVLGAMKNPPKPPIPRGK